MDDRQSKNHNDESEDFESLLPIARFDFEEYHFTIRKNIMNILQQ